MRKFKKTLDHLIEANPEGNDFLCSLDYKKYASILNFTYKGFDIVCSSKVPKDGLYFLKYSLS